MSPRPEDEIAALLRSAYGGDAGVEMTDDGLNFWVRPASGGSMHARLADVNSPVLAALLGMVLDRNIDTSTLRGKLIASLDSAIPTTRRDDGDRGDYAAGAPWRDPAHGVP
jgi:hypothetical protein